MKILLVDDSKFFRSALVKELELKTYEITEAIHGRDALDKLETEIYDLIILDIEMPELNGFETCEKMNCHFAKNNMSVPIIFLTASDKLEDRLRGFELGATEFLQKKYEEGEFVAAVDKILRPEKRFQGLKALLVDDSNTCIRVTEDILKKEGIEVIVVKNGEAAFNVLKVKGAELDLVISDMEMPILNGLELCRLMRKELGLLGIPFILNSTNYRREQIMEYFSSGVTDFIQKPFTKEEFVSRIFSHIDAHAVKKKLKKNLEETIRLNEMKDKFLSICSHDLRSPIGSIVGFSELLLAEDDLINDEMKEGLTHIKNSSYFLLDLINELLDLNNSFHEDTKIKLRRSSLDELLKNSISMMNKQAEIKNINIEYENTLSANSFSNVDELAMKRVFNNLISNAIKFTSSKGCIKIACKKIESGCIEISFKDNGVGISNENISRLFDRHAKFSDKGTNGEIGTGLGLSIVHSIIEKHNGEIKATSILGKGTEIKITLPSYQIKHAA